MVPNTTRFLILDDISAIRAMLKQNLKELGIVHPPLEAENVAKALELMEKSLQGGDVKIEFILSDWNLPDDTGLSFLKKVRSNPSFDHIPFVMVTTENEINRMLDAINEGCNNYVVKPWTIDDLKEKIHNAWDTVEKSLKTKPKDAARPSHAIGGASSSQAASKTPDKSPPKTGPHSPQKAGMQRPNIRKGTPSAPPKKKEIEKKEEATKKKSFWEKLFGK